MNGNKVWSMMSVEVVFYHLLHKPLEAALPQLLLKCLERDWKVVVQTGTEQRCNALDAHLWTFSDDSFLPHGTKADGYAADMVYEIAAAHGDALDIDGESDADPADGGPVPVENWMIYCDEAGMPREGQA